MKNHFRVIISKSATEQLSISRETLDIQLELLFSCLLRKRILFHIPNDIVTYPVHSDNKQLNICFRPIMTRVCAIRDVVDVPDMEDLPIHRAEAFMPNWLKLDYRRRKNTWSGEFGWLDKQGAFV